MLEVLVRPFHVNETWGRLMCRNVCLLGMFLGLLSGCEGQPPSSQGDNAQEHSGEAVTTQEGKEGSSSGAGQFKVVHVFVALCDNQNQGIVPVPAAR